MKSIRICPGRLPGRSLLSVAVCRASKTYKKPQRFHGELSLSVEIVERGYLAYRLRKARSIYLISNQLGGFVNTATGTIKDKRSDDERSDRRRGMKLVPRGERVDRIRIAMCPDLVNSFQGSGSRSTSRKPALEAKDDEISRSNIENASPEKRTTIPGSVPVAITLTAVALTGLMVGYLLRRGRD